MLTALVLSAVALTALFVASLALAGPPADGDTSRWVSAGEALKVVLGVLAAAAELLK